MKFHLHCFALLPLLFTNCQCTPDPNCVEFPGGKQYSVNASVEILPMQATYRLGDTIRVAVRIPDRSPLEGRADSISLHLLEFEDLFIDLAALFVDNNNTPLFAEGEQYFTFIPLKGTLTPKPNTVNPRLMAFEPVKGTESSLMEFVLIPLAAGTYKLGLFTPQVVSTGLFDDYCYSETQVYFPLADDRDSGNYHLALPYQSLLGAYDVYKKNGTFTFQVLD